MIPTSHKNFKIIAPVTIPDDIECFSKDGADEFYCGALLNDWIKDYGDSDLANRRQGVLANIRNFQELKQIADISNKVHRPIFLTLNAKYSAIQENSIFTLAKAWEDMGGTGIITSDIVLLLKLNEIKSKLIRHLSIMGAVFNVMSAQFFAELGISRIILPRSLRIQEIDYLIKNGPKIEYEVIALNQKCQFIDGFCSFYHGIRIPKDTPSIFEYERVRKCKKPAVWSYDLFYEGHGCQIPYKTNTGSVKHIFVNDEEFPHCAACSIPSLHSAGVMHLKIAGRGYSTECLTRSIRFLRNAVDSFKDDGRNQIFFETMEERYSHFFNRRCNRSRCYYNFSRNNE